MTRKQRTIPREVTIEAWLFVAALAGTVWLYQAGFISTFIMLSFELGPLIGGFLAGAAFATFVTTPFAVAGFLGIGADLPAPIWQIALTGALGATVVDLFLIRTLRSPVAVLLVRGIVGHDTTALKRRLSRSTTLKWLAALFGGFLIAIPLPTDELGIAFLGSSGLRTIQMLPLIFFADFIGIYVIVATGVALAGA